MSRSASAPASTERPARPTASWVELLPAPATTGTSPPTSSATAATTSTCSSWVSVALSPVVPTGTTPSTPRSTRRRACVCRRSKSMLPSSDSGVVIAGKTPSSGVYVIVVGNAGFAGGSDNEEPATGVLRPRRAYRTGVGLRFPEKAAATLPAATTAVGASVIPPNGAPSLIGLSSPTAVAGVRVPSAFCRLWPDSRVNAGPRRRTRNHRRAPPGAVRRLPGRRRDGRGPGRRPHVLRRPLPDVLHRREQRGLRHHRRAPERPRRERRRLQRHPPAQHGRDRRRPPRRGALRELRPHPVRQTTGRPPRRPPPALRPRRRRGSQTTR